MKYVNAETLERETLFFASIEKMDTTIPDRFKQTLKRELSGEKPQVILESQNYGYPEGIYSTKEDFIKKTPSSRDAVFASEFGTTKLEEAPIGSHLVFFYDKKSRKKLKNIFAISDKGHLYFQIKQILKNRNKKDRAQTNNNYNLFVRVIMGGDHYLYTEAPLINQWAQGAMYGAIGGVTGAILAEEVTYGKGIVWDIKNEEFNIFKNCFDYNKFMSEIYPDGIQDCPRQQPDVLKIRETMEVIK